MRLAQSAAPAEPTAHVRRPWRKGLDALAGLMAALALTVTLGPDAKASGVSGFGIALLDFNPAATSENNFSEAGLFVYGVPEPGSLGLVAPGLVALGKAATPRWRIGKPLRLARQPLVG